MRMFEVATVIGRRVEVDGLGGCWQFEAQPFGAQPKEGEQVVARLRADWLGIEDEARHNDTTGAVMMPEQLWIDAPHWHVELTDAERERVLRVAFPVTYRHNLLEPRRCYPPKPKNTP